MRTVTGEREEVIPEKYRAGRNRKLGELLKILTWIVFVSDLTDFSLPRFLLDVSNIFGREDG